MIIMIMPRPGPGPGPQGSTDLKVCRRAAARTFRVIRVLGFIFDAGAAVAAAMTRIGPLAVRRPVANRDSGLNISPRARWVVCPLGPAAAPGEGIMMPGP